MTISVSESELNALQQLVGECYRPLSLLGKKSGRKTLLAEDRQTKTKVVIKLLTFGEDFNWDDLKLFEREAETLRSLDHPAIPQYLDYFDVETPRSKGFALVQTYLEARSLAEQVKAGRRFSEEELEQIAQQLLEILEYLHSRQPAVIHRDIKPSNILLTDRTAHSVGQVYLVDFGSVQTLAAREGGTITVVGTYGYMPPEQFGGRAVPASDLYSLGATLIYLASGRHPADLPQDELRLEFEEFVQLSPKMMSWLKTLTEPGLGRRFESSAEAIATSNALSRTALFATSSPSISSSKIELDGAFSQRFSSPQLGSSLKFEQGSEALSFQFPSKSFKLTSVQEKRTETGCARIFLMVIVGLLGLGIFLSIYSGVSSVIGAFPASFVLLAILILIFRLSRRANNMTTLIINAGEIRVQRPYVAEQVFSRRHAWQLRRDSMWRFSLLVGINQLTFAMSPEDSQWLSQTLGQALQLPEDLEKHYFVDDASKA